MGILLFSAKFAKRNKFSNFQVFLFASLTNDTASKKSTGIYSLTLLHSERPKFYGVLAVLSAIGLRKEFAHTRAMS